VKEAPKFLNLTVSIVSDKFKVNGAVARRVLRDLHSKNLIKQVGDHHSSFTLYTGSQAKSAQEAAAPAKK
jgi:small subunit ribosomal protein S25e